MKEYPEFNDWFNEVENYGTRSERFYEELQSITPARAVEWLQAAWECSRKDIPNGKP